MTKKTGLGVFLLTAIVWSQASMGQDVWDTDGDGYDDNNDNCTLVANPAQVDADRDAMGNMCDADFNNDNEINAADLGIMKASFFTADPLTDINADGITNVADLGLLKAMFFTNPGPTGTDPDQPPCTCYFSGDCPSGTFCDYGPGSYPTEDICAWRDIKPNGEVGAGCSIESDLTTGAWTPSICDGVCKPFTNGSTIGREKADVIAQSIQIWGDAMINPSAAGGGPVDAALAEQALTTQFSAEGVPMVLGRQTADALAMAAGEPFHNYFCHWEGHPDDGNPPVVNLAGDTCLVTSGRLTIEALAAEIKSPGSAPEIMKGITQVCPNWQQMFSTQCAPGPGALNCAIRFIQAQAYFLSTPLLVDPNTPDAIDLLLTNQ